MEEKSNKRNRNVFESDHSDDNQIRMCRFGVFSATKAELLQFIENKAAEYSARSDAPPPPKRMKYNHSYE